MHEHVFQEFSLELSQVWQGSAIFPGLYICPEGMTHVSGNRHFQGQPLYGKTSVICLMAQ